MSLAEFVNGRVDYFINTDNLLRLQILLEASKLNFSCGKRWDCNKCNFRNRPTLKLIAYQVDLDISQFSCRFAALVLLRMYDKEMAEITVEEMLG